MKPPRSILDPRFVYRDSANTDVAETFRRVRARTAADAEYASWFPIVKPIPFQVETITRNVLEWTRSKPARSKGEAR